MRTILMMALIAIISIFGGTGSVAYANDYGVEIGNEFTPKIVSMQELPENISTGGNVIINGNFLWIMGTETFVGENGKRDMKSMISVFDISKPSEPKFLATHEHGLFVRDITFRGNYAYLLCAK
ncbi:MAG: hypothetical protein ABII03_00410, partial [Nanoarchaeota archaeon]